MTTVQELRVKAKRAGIPTSIIRSAKTQEELLRWLEHFERGKSHRREVQRKVAPRKKIVAKKKPTPAPQAKRKNAPTRPSTRQTPKPMKPKAQPKPQVKSSPARDGEQYRNLLTDIDWNKTDGPGGGWKPREDSAVDVMYQALRQHKGDREKAFEEITQNYNIWQFVGRVKDTGEKRGKADAENYLRYRIARTAWDFALKTGQHTKNELWGTKGQADGTKRTPEPRRGPGRPRKAPAPAKPAQAVRKAPVQAETAPDYAGMTRAELIAALQGGKPTTTRKRVAKAGSRK